MSHPDNDPSRSPTSEPANAPSSRCSAEAFDLLSWGTGPDANMLDLTVDQLRTLVVVADEGSALAAARAMGRQASTVQTQLKVMNERFIEVCGERICHANGRNERFVFTHTGQAVVRVAREILESLAREVRQLRNDVSGGVVVATTTYPQPFVWQAWNAMDPSARARSRLFTHQIRTRDVSKTLRSDAFDLVVAPHVTEAGMTDFGAEWEFVPRVTERLAVLTQEGERAHNRRSRRPQWACCKPGVAVHR